MVDYTKENQAEGFESWLNAAAQTFEIVTGKQLSEFELGDSLRSLFDAGRGTFDATINLIQILLVLGKLQASDIGL